MILSYQWLLDYLPKALPADELGRILTSVGLEVEGLEPMGNPGALDALRVGEVLTCAPHPNADKLRLTTVNIGGPEPLHIVCGAPNVAAGQKVIVAPVGATLHPAGGEPFQIKKAKIRGELSEGMICAEDEIGVGSSHDGIIVLPEATPIGITATEYFKLPEPDTAIHIGLTPNRSDANSHIGAARDVCAYLSHHEGADYPLQLPEAVPVAGSGPSPISVKVLEPKACPRYAGLTIRGLKVAPSPDWLVARLATVGIRSINNVVDVTNYILQEWGQPLHAFDAARLAGNTIEVRFAKADERFVTLDGKERTLRGGEDLLICSGAAPVAMAGVFGGLDSGVTEATTDVFIESACFDPTTIRRTSLHHGLRTDAATHFEKGVDIAQVETVLLRAAALMISVAGGQVDGGVVDVYPAPQALLRLPIRFDHIDRLAGKSYAPDAVCGILQSLGFGLSERTDEGCVLLVPSSKTDITQLADVVEEVLRIDGLDHIPIPQRLQMSLMSQLPSDRAQREKVATGLAGLGFSEIVTNSITNSKYYAADADLARLLNSLSTELDVMRPSMLETGLEVVSYNLARRNLDLLLFEFGFVYDGSFAQRAVLALFASGHAQPAAVGGKPLPANLFFLKSAVQHLLRQSGIQKTMMGYENDEVFWKWKNKMLCRIAEVPAEKCKAFDIKERVWYAEIDWALWVEGMAATGITYSEVPRFPSVRRDLALVLDKSVRYADVQRVTERLKLQPLQSYSLFDVFEGESLGAGKKSLALSYTFQLQDRTLTDTETEALMQQLSRAYTKELGAQIRG